MLIELSCAATGELAMQQANLLAVEGIVQKCGSEFRKVLQYLQEHPYIKEGFAQVLVFKRNVHTVLKFYAKVVFLHASVLHPRVNSLFFPVHTVLSKLVCTPGIVHPFAMNGLLTGGGANFGAHFKALALKVLLNVDACRDNKSILTLHFLWILFTWNQIASAYMKLTGALQVPYFLTIFYRRPFRCRT